MSMVFDIAAMRHRLLRLAGMLLCVGLLVSMTGGAIVHAAEAQCADESVMATADSGLHDDGMNPGDASSGKATHAAHSCHGHHAAVAAVSGDSRPPSHLADRKTASTASPLADTVAGRLLRPPIA